MKVAPVDTQPDRLIGVEALAGLLSVRPRTVWKLRASRRLPPAIRVGRAVRWRLSDVQQFIARGCELPDE